jgi:hypothetical protein
MQLSPPSQTPPPRHCPICRATLPPALPFCAVCGAELEKGSTRTEEELRGVLYLLSELKRWESSRRITEEQAEHLRRVYERRRDQLRRKLSDREGERASQTTDTTPAEELPFPRTAQAPAPELKTAPPRPPQTERVQDGGQPRAFPTQPRSSIPGQGGVPHQAPTPPTPQTFQRPPQRPLLERLADPRTLRLLLYTGAGMLVVGVVIWLRDLLYLKLQEPVVQAWLLFLGTAGFTASGWYTILRTRQRWTGRALTLAGSLLVPVNFWFLVRSGLIENHGRAWVVCVFCALLYASTAAALRERLYVYLACAATVATLWTLVLRDAERAIGLYPLSLMAASLVFLHLSRLFTQTNGERAEATEEDESAGERHQPWIDLRSYELWGAPLARSALAGAALSVIFYLPLRLLPDAASFYNRAPLWRSNAYDPGVALSLLAAGAYVLWFAGRYIYSRWGAAFYTLSLLTLFLATWAACDGFRLLPESMVLALALPTLLSALVARLSSRDALSQPLRHASLVMCSLLAIACVSVLFSAETFTLTESACFASVAAAFALLSGERFSTQIEQTALALFSALYFSAGYFVALASTTLKSETIITTLCVLWPLALFGVAELATKLRREEQLATPFTRVADAQVLLLLLWGSLLALLLHLMEGGVSRPSALVALSGVLLYSLWRIARGRSLYCAMLGTMAALSMTAAILDALKNYGLWPKAWPIAVGPILFAFALDKAAARMVSTRSVDERIAWQPLMAGVRLVLDLAVVACAMLWLITALASVGTVGYAAPSVLLLALLYWAERAASLRQGWIVRVGSAHLGAFLLTLLIALRVAPEWINLLFVLTIFTTFFALSRYARNSAWLSAPLREAAMTALGLSLLFALVQAGPHLQAGDARLLAPSMTAGAIALLAFVASIFSRGRESVLYFRAGLWVSVVALMLVSMRAGFDPLADVEVYTTPVAVLILIIAYLSHRRAWAEYDRDVGALLWVGSLLLCVPLLLRSLEFRLLLDESAPWRDLAVLMASLALVLYGAVGRMRAPVLAGSITLIVELVVLTLTSVDWLQVPIKYYLITVGALLFVTFGALEYRREQFLLMHKRFQERRDYMRQQFGGWR